MKKNLFFFKKKLRNFSMYMLSFIFFLFFAVTPAAQTCEHLGFVILDPENSLLA